MNKGLFGYTAKIDKGGYVTLEPNDMVGPASPQQEAMHKYLDQIISSSSDVTVDVGSSTKDTLVGSYVGESIDIGDIEAMAGKGGATEEGALIHELVEQYHKQVKGTGYGGESSGAHGKGIAAENEVNGTVRGAQKVVRVTQNADGTINAVVEIPYTHPDGRVVTTTLTITENNVTKAEDKVTKTASKKGSGGK
ncbi:MAG: hypothetical protein MJE77_20265 [Proteobacteria bacterium]|nr:hypothetical protein [Pseudomonadota bacterium]